VARIITVAAAPAVNCEMAARRAEVIIAGERDVDLAAALGALSARGFSQVLAEGGPSLNGQLAAAGLIDEVCLTVSPLLVSGDAKRVLAGPGLPAGPPWRLYSLCEQDGFLFLRYRRRVANPPGAGARPMCPVAAYRAAASTCSATLCQAARVVARWAALLAAPGVVAVMPATSRAGHWRYENGSGAGAESGWRECTGLG
jgi:RibD C-terminal domain